MELCARCTGRRLVGAIGQEAQEAAAKESGRTTVTPAECPVCDDAFSDAPRWLETVLAALDGHEGTTFQVGTVFPAESEVLEKSLAWNPEVGDTLRTEANRWLSPRIADATGMQLVTDARPDLVIQLDTRFWTCEVNPNTVFIEGRYTKFRRDIPQTHWPCKRCQGLGCWECDRTGVMYGESVEKAVAGPAEAAFEAQGSSFHGAGREDIDALMLGTGRPFVLELKAPKKRAIDLTPVEAAINAATDKTGVGVQDLRMSSKDRVQELKAGEYDKEYLAHCETEADVSRDQVLAAATAMSGVMLEQRTPERVSHRRADLVRKRAVHAMTIEQFDDARHFSVRVRADSGAYIKEMVSGDEGRTTPNLSEALGVPCKVAQLDVTAIFDAPGDGADPKPAAE